MPQRKSYGQFCGLARSLDRVGDRWTLLVVRELLLGPRTFRQLQEALAGVSPSLLTQRMAALVDDGIAQRNDAPPRSKAVDYSLTPSGLALESVVLELIRWGGRWMVDGPGQDHADPGWAPLALRALLEGERAPTRGSLHVNVSGTCVTVRSHRDRRTVAAGREGSAGATIITELPTALAIASGAVQLDATDAHVSGDRRVAALLQGPPMGGDSQRDPVASTIYGRTPPMTRHSRMP